jgi:hypothetical protein
MAKNVQLTIDIKGDDSVGKAAEKTKSLKTQLRELKAELASGSLTGKAFDEVAQKAGKLQEQLDDVNQSVKSLANNNAEIALNGFMSLANGIIGGFTAAQGAMALFGDENKDLQKQMVKLQGAIALLNGVEAINNSLKKEGGLLTAANTIKTNVLTFAQARYTAAVGTTTGAMKIMRLVGMTLGIGLIVAAVGLLIANFDKVKAVVMGVVDRFKGMSGTMKNVLSIIFPFIGAIRLVVLGLEKMGIIDDDATSAMKKNAAERLASQRAQVKELTKTQSKLENYYDFEIAKAKAAGKNTYEIEQKKREEILKTLRLINDAQRESITNKTATKDEIESWNERQKLITQIQQEGEVARIDSETKATEKQNEINEKAAEKTKAAQEKKQQQAIKDAEELQKILEDAAIIKGEKDLTEEEKELAALGRSYKAKLDLAKDDNKAQDKIIAASLIERQAIIDKYAKTEEEKKKEAAKVIADLIEQRRVDDLSVREKELFDIEEKYANEAELAKGQADLLAQIEIDKNNALLNKKKEFAQQDADFQKEVDLVRLDAIVATANQASQLIDQLAGKNKAAALTALAVEKGAAIADVVIKGIREKADISAKFGTTPAYPFLLGASIARTSLSVAKIAATGISGAKSINSAGGSGGSVPPPDIRGTQTTNEPQGRNRVPETKVFVTETDIRAVSRKVDGIYSQATIR